MKELDLAERAHAELDAEYARKEFRASSRGQINAEQRYQELRRINDSAYFLVIFGTFERYITQRAETAALARTGKQLYRHRRAWDTLIVDGEISTSFLNRVRVILDANSAEFGKIKGYYKVRNDLAHEGITARTFSVPSVVTDLRQAWRKMKT